MEQDVARDPQRPPLVATLTLGCKLNQAETQAAARELQAAGCVTVDRPAAADAWLINTCSVTRVADRKARRLIRVAKRLSPNAPVIVTGCYAEHAADTLITEVGADVVVRNADKATAASAVLRALGAVNGRDPASAASPRAAPEPSSRFRRAATMSAPSASCPTCAAASAPCRSTPSSARPRNAPRKACRRSS